MVASDRLSAFDVVMDEPVPDKGRVLTAMSAFWFEHLGDVAPNHLSRPTSQPAARGARRAAGRADDARAALRDAAGRVHRARAPGGLGVEGVPGDGHDARRAAAGRAPRVRRACPRPCSPRRPRPRAAITTRTSRSTTPSRSSAATRAEQARALSAWPCTRPAAGHAEAAGIIVADTKFELGVRRRRARARRRGAHARLVAVLAGGRVGARLDAAGVRQAARARLARGARAGTSARRRRRCPPRWSPPPGPATSRPTSASRADPSPTGPERSGGRLGMTRVTAA